MSQKIFIKYYYSRTIFYVIRSFVVSIVSEAGSLRFQGLCLDLGLKQKYVVVVCCVCDALVVAHGGVF